ncbi:FecCD family ABC transporter permease [Pseudonocardia sp. GCM10023141]|uniref:FecCD family ABC transporter permease n=1 Tax=Pseudonocardia sp. GCM10023141 TaxID=3252653 RepID=UPI00360F38D7
MSRATSLATPPGARSSRDHRVGPWRRLGALAGLALLLGFVGLLSLRAGSLPISWQDAVAGLFAYPGPDAATAEQIIVHDLRIPRTVVGLAVGAALGVTGSLMQGLTRNALADPGLLGVNAGAAFAITAAITFLAPSYQAYPWFAFAGVIAAGVLVYSTGSIGGGATPTRLALAGAIVTAFIGTVTASLNLLNPAAADLSRYWLAGALTGVSLAEFAQVAPSLVIGLGLAVTLGRALNGLALGDEIARSHGQRVVLTRVIVAVAVILLAGTAVALAGPIAFIGLMVPHLCRFVVGPDYRWIVPTSALLGAAILLLCDVAGRVAGPGEIAVGVMTAALGAPVFILVARRRRSVASL